MSLLLNEEQEMLRDAAHAFIGENAPVAHLRRLRRDRDANGYSPALWKRFGELGFSATLVPEANGGLGLGLVDACVIAEEIGRTLMPSPFLSTAVLSARALAAAGGTAAAALLPQVAAAEIIIALAIDEKPKHQPNVISTLARAEGDGFRIDGEKAFVVDGHAARQLIVSVHASPADAGGLGGVTLFLLDARTPGVSIERMSMLDAHNAARVRLAGVKLRADQLLGQVGGGETVLEQALMAGRVVIAAELLGIADEVFARTLAYLKERKQFDRVIGSFQALQHRAAALYCDIELTRAMVMRAAHAIDVGAEQAAKAASAAKALACATANLAVREGVQMHGGMGMTDEFDMGLFMKRARTLQELLGDANFHADRFARLTGY